MELVKEIKADGKKYVVKITKTKDYTYFCRLFKDDKLEFFKDCKSLVGSYVEVIKNFYYDYLAYKAQKELELKKELEMKKELENWDGTIKTK